MTNLGASEVWFASAATVRHVTTPEVSNAQVVSSWRHLLADVSTALRRTSSDREEVVLDTVIDGVRYSLVRSVVDEPAQRPADPPAMLSGRELEIARMVAKGYTNKTMAAVLGISPWTVDTHLRRIFRKLSVGSRSAMVTRLTREGLLDEQATPEWSDAWQEHVAAGTGRRAVRH